MLGATDRFLPVVTVTLEHPIRSREGFLFLLRAVLRFDGASDGFMVRTTGPQGSGILSSLSLANGLIVVPEDCSSLDAGDRVRVQLLPSFLLSSLESDLRGP